MNFYFDTFKTPFGSFSVAVDENGSVAAAVFGSDSVLRPYLDDCHVIRDKIKTRAARGQVLAYCAGHRRDFELPLAANGTPFQQKIWTALTKIPFGATRSYGELARQVGSPKAARAVGHANAVNPICLIVPCHRVIGADGSLTGFAFGEKLKRRLLDHERSIASAARAA